ncbi:MAG: AbrB/MazE/SpoVT family DNA-binding domain-containing protein [Clostridiales bacterium]|nr:AbrB/MazE/SpoVT family DNA-binding domain-containing protein [Clostridiales bacterium]
MLSQVSKWGNSQGIRISKKLLLNVGIELHDKVEIMSRGNMLLIKPIAKKTLDWYLESYEGELDRYDWGDSDEPRGRELL